MYQKSMLGLDEAMAALQAMIKEAGKEPGRPLAFAIVDDAGELLAYARMDRVAPGPQKLATRKAYTAARARSTTKAYVERIHSMGLHLSDLGDPLLTGTQGGVAIVTSDGICLGGIGVSGRRAEEDEALAMVGLKATGL